MLYCIQQTRKGSILAAFLSRMFELTLWGEFNDQQKDNV